MYLNYEKEMYNERRKEGERGPFGRLLALLKAELTSSREKKGRRKKIKKEMRLLIKTNLA